MKTNDQDDDILTDALEGRLSDGDLTSLAERLKHDVALAGRMIELARDEALLGELLARGETGEKEKRVSEDPVRGRGIVMAWRRWGAIAAGVAAVIAAVWWMAGERNAESRQTRDRRGTVVARVEAVDSGQWTVDSGDRGQRTEDSGQYGRKRELKVGDEIRVGEKGKVVLAYGVPSSPDGLRRGTWARVELGAGSILSMRPMSPKGPTSPISKLERGTLTAEVAKQVHGLQFAVETPHAVVLVRGTRFRIDVDEASSRLEVREGLVALTRLSDGESVDVAAGQYAVAAEGVQLAALALPERPARKVIAGAPRPQWIEGKYGDIIFEDAMDDLVNWDIVIGSPREGYRAVTADPESYWEMGVYWSHLPSSHPANKKKVFVLNPRPEETRGRFVGIRSKKPIDVEKFVVEVRMGFQGSGSDTAVVAEGLEALEKDIVPIAEWRAGAFSLMPMWYRLEFAPAKNAPEEGMLVRRFFYGSIASDASYVRPTSRRILVAVSNVAGCIDRVRVCRLSENYDLE